MVDMLLYLLFLALNSYPDRSKVCYFVSFTNLTCNSGVKNDSISVQAVMKKKRISYSLFAAYFCVLEMKCNEKIARDFVAIIIWLLSEQGLVG